MKVEHSVEPLDEKDARIAMLEPLLRAAEKMREAKLKGSVGERSNHSNLIRIRTRSRLKSLSESKKIIGIQQKF